MLSKRKQPPNVFTQDLWDDHLDFCREEISAQSRFWDFLPWMPDGKVLWDYVKKYSPDIVSSPLAGDPDCMAGKIYWIEKNLGADAGDVYLVRRSIKIRYSWDIPTDSPNLLIDDHPKTVAEWKAMGAPAILHRSAESTIQELRGLGL